MKLQSLTADIFSVKNLSNSACSLVSPPAGILRPDARDQGPQDGGREREEREEEKEKPGEKNPRTLLYFIMAAGDWSQPTLLR